MASSGALAIVISAPGIEQATFEQAESSEHLVNVKVAHQLEVVSSARANDAQAKLNLGMRIFFHQGGAPSKWSREFPRAGCLIAAGYYAAIHPLGSGSPPPGIPQELWETETGVFAPPQWEFTHFVRYHGVRRISDRVLTKEIIGRWPRRGENFIVVDPQDEGFLELDRLWYSVMS